jgi:hypothetical protein
VFTTKYCKLCRAKRRTKKGKFTPFSEAEHNRIVALYASHPTRQALDLLVQEIKRPRWKIRSAAVVLGAATVRTKEPPWSDAEREVLREFGWMHPQGIQKKFAARGFSRTKTSIAIMRKRLRIREKIDGMTAQGLAQTLGVDTHRVLGWIHDGSIAAVRSGTSGTPGANHDHWYISTEAIRRFLHANWEVVEIGKIERTGSKLWLFEMLTGHAEPATSSPGTASAALAAPQPERRVALYGERVTLRALSEISGRPVAELLHRLDELGMSVAEAAFGDPAEASPATTAERSPLTTSLLAQVRALMKMHRASTRDVARWVELPEALVIRLLDGTVPSVSPALNAVVRALEGEISISPKRLTKAS